MTSTGRPASADQQVERVDGLGEQHAAAVARLGAAAGLVVIALRPPVVQPRRSADDLAEPALRMISRERRRCRAEAVLQHDAELDARLLRGLDQLSGALEADLQRLFQQDVFAGRGRPRTRSRCVLGGVRIITASIEGSAKIASSSSTTGKP